MLCNGQFFKSNDVPAGWREYVRATYQADLGIHTKIDIKYRVCMSQKRILNVLQKRVSPAVFPLRTSCTPRDLLLTLIRFSDGQRKALFTYTTNPTIPQSHDEVLRPSWGPSVPRFYFPCRIRPRQNILWKLLF